MSNNGQGIASSASGKRSTKRLGISLAITLGLTFGIFSQASAQAIDRLESTSQCDQTTVQTVTYCTRSDAPGEGRCFAQQISLRNGGGTYTVFLTNPDAASDRSLARGGQCVSKGNAHWLVIASSNLGAGDTCTDCERSDVFALAPSPRYAGSVGTLPRLVLAAPDPLKPLQDTDAIDAYRARIRKPGAPIYDFDIQWFVR